MKADSRPPGCERSVVRCCRFLLAAVPASPRRLGFVNELAVLADRRRAADREPNSDALEAWHRTCLTGFIQRMRDRLEEQCNDGHHKDWPGKPREQAFQSVKSSDLRRQRLVLDHAASTELARRLPPITFGELRRKKRVDLTYPFVDEP